jgi:hypothetical protein
LEKNQEKNEIDSYWSETDKTIIKLQ